MKTIVILLLSLGFFSTISGQTTTQKLSFEVLSSSKLSIRGDTNIRGFLCPFNTAWLQPNNNVSFRIKENNIFFENASLELNNFGFDCGNKKINKDFHSLLRTSEYPVIVLELKRLSETSPKKTVAEVVISIAGKKKKYMVPVEITKGTVSNYKGNLILNINDFNLEPPKKLLGLIVIKEDIEISFNLNILK